MREVFIDGWTKSCDGSASPYSLILRKNVLALLEVGMVETTTLHLKVVTLVTTIAVILFKHVMPTVELQGRVYRLQLRSLNQIVLSFFLLHDQMHQSRHGG